jgi:branched-chain amino acid transport system substrate-binding protein
LKMKRFVTLFFSLTMVLALISACSNASSQGNAKNSGVNNAQQTSNKDSSTPDKKSGNNETITIGGIFPLTGSGAQYGEWYKQGAELAIEDINNAGGIKGKKLVGEYQDGRAEPKASVLAAQDLSAKGITAILSAYTGVTLAVLPIAERNNIVVFNGGGQGDALAGASPHLFNTIPLLGLEVEALVKYLREEKKDLKTAYVVYVDDDSGRTGLKIFKEQFEKLGGKVVESGSHKAGETNFRSILIKAKASNPDLIYIAAHGNDAKLTIDQIRELGIKSQIVNTSWTIIPDILNSASAQGIIHTALKFNPDKAWVDRYKQKYGTDQVSSYVANFYDAVMVYKKAYEYAVDKGYGTDGKALIKAIKEIKSFESANGKLEFKDDGTSIRDVNIAVIKDKTSQVVKSY